jgi:hypothetical protein
VRRTYHKARHGELTDILAAQPQLPAPETLAELAGYLPAMLTTTSDPVERKAAIEALIHEIRLTEEGLIPVYKIPNPTQLSNLTSEEAVRTMGQQVGVWGTNLGIGKTGNRLFETGWSTGASVSIAGRWVC